jgi:hypothetical protein
MPTGLLGHLKHRHRTGTRCNHLTVSEANPLAAILVEDLVADGPVIQFILSSVGIESV